MKSSPLLLTLLAATTTLSSPTPSPFSAAIAKVCTSYTIPLTVTTANFNFSGPKFETNYDVTDFTTDLSSLFANETFHPLLPPTKNETATYTLSGTFCTPTDSKAKNRKTVLLATHGLNFNRNYWDAEIEPQTYSFVDYAVAQGYSVFFYDRLGVGKSQKISGYVNQLSIQTALAIKLTQAVKAGNYTGAIGKPDKLVLVGHSYGSAISAAVATAEPALADGLILTGFTFAGLPATSFVQVSQFKIAALQNKEKWGSLDTGYITLADRFSNINAFFKKPDYSIAVVDYADANKEPIALSELLTATLVPVTPFKFTGAAMVIAGQFDLIFCESACDKIMEHPAKEIFGHAKAFQAISYPGSGHGLNFALSAPGIYKTVFDFINKNI